MNNNQLAERPNQKNDLRVIIQSDQVREQLVAALPRYYTPEQFTVIVRTAINRNPKLSECDPGSFLTSMITAAQMGIAPNGREGHLIPRWNGKAQRMECQFQADYKGLIGLVRRNEDVADIYAEVVREADSFVITQGLHRDIIHEVDIRKPRGPIIGVYAVIQFKERNLPPSWTFLSREEVESVRERSESWRAHQSKGYDTPWLTDEGEMFKKTALKRLIKTADLSQDTMERVAAERDIELAAMPVSGPEIRRASLPEPVLPEPVLPEPMPEPVLPELKPKKTLARKKKPAPEPVEANGDEASEAPADDEVPVAVRPIVEQVRARLVADDITEADLIRGLAAMEITDDNVSAIDLRKTRLHDFALDTLETLIDPENWAVVIAETKNLQ
jgi:recombination protein RecT